MSPTQSPSLRLSQPSSTCWARGPSICGRRANQTLKDQIKEKAAHLTTKELDSDDSSVSSSVGSSKGHRHHKKGKHRGRRGSREDLSDDGLEWSYNQLGMLQSSPASSRKEREGRRKMERKPTPLPTQTQLPLSIQT